MFVGYLLLTTTTMTIQDLKDNREQIITLINKYATTYCKGTQMTMKEAMTIYAKWALKGKSAPIQWVEKEMKKSITKMSMAEYNSGTQHGAQRLALGSRFN